MTGHMKLVLFKNKFFHTASARRERAGKGDAGLVGPASSEAELIKKATNRMKPVPYEASTI